MQYKNNKAITYEKTGQVVQKNILCYNKSPRGGFLYGNTRHYK